MSNKDFAELCTGTASMLQALAKQCVATDGEMVFDERYVGETLAPMLKIVTAIAESAK